MTKVAIIVDAAVVLASVVAFTFRRKAGYRGAVGFKNRHAGETATIRALGFSESVDSRSLAKGEHSFNYLSRQDIPIEVQITWRFVDDISEMTASVSLSSVPKAT